jgi:thiol-disulfide isomerase/thioredoxin
MYVLVAAVVLLGALCMVNLLLTYGVIRRLRHHTELLSTRSAAPDAGDLMLPAGSSVRDFAVTDRDGGSVSPATFTAPTLVAFLSPGCGPCETLLPQFAHAAREWPGGPDQVLAVVAGEGDGDHDGDEATFASHLAPVATVVVEGAQEMATAFGVRGYPVLCVVDNAGTITWTGRKMEAIKRPVVA